MTDEALLRQFFCCKSLCLLSGLISNAAMKSRAIEGRRKICIFPFFALVLQLTVGGKLTGHLVFFFHCKMLLLYISTTACSTQQCLKRAWGKWAGVILLCYLTQLPSRLPLHCACSLCAEKLACTRYFVVIWLFNNIFVSQQHVTT